MRTAPPDTPPARPIEFRSVAAQFGATAQSRRDQVALRAATQTVTYGELLSAVQAQAGSHTTEAADTGGAEPRAALVSAPLNPATVATILGLFAARTAVVALDPAMPDNRALRIAEILREHGYQVTDAEVPAEMPCGAVDGSPATTELGASADLDDVTSIQFTSGSTGAPKAVLHPNGLWLCDAQLLNDRFGLSDGRRVALCMPISFAAGLNVLIGSLLGGAEIVAVDPREYSATDAFDRIASSAAQAITCTPAFIDALHTAAQGATLPNVERIVTTGEPAHARHIRLARELAPHAVFTNWVGSTEVLGIASFDVAPSAPLPTGVIPVGIPVRHKRVDVGHDGTVSITSRYLGLRYLDPATASGTFVDNADGTRTYAGGDVGRWDESGNLVLSGRADSTVKIRGYLVEPSEIESTLLSYDDVREATVTADTTGTPTLTAYIALTTTSRTPSMAELRTRLHGDLPPWMVPTHIVPLAALPRTDRGKIDRMALPRADRPAFEPPRGEGEVAVARLWADLLHVEAVGRSDGFYALGGDSLTVAQMLSRINETHGIELNPSDLAAAPTVAQFAQRLVGAGGQRSQPGGPRLSPTTVPLRAISATTSGPPLMCFPGAGAASLAFAPLAAQVGSETAVYAFAPKGLEKRAIPDLSVRGAARRHVTDLRRIQPQGPYVLVGHCLGAHIALEVARRLENDGARVDLVVMLDPWLSPRAANAVRGDLTDVTLTLEGAAPTDLRSWWDHQKRVPLAGLFLGGNERKASAVEEMGMVAGMRYQPTPWSGRALVILSHLNRDDPRLWPRILTGDLTTRRLECDHNSIVREPHVNAVIEMINEVRHGDAISDMSATSA